MSRSATAATRAGITVAPRPKGVKEAVNLNDLVSLSDFETSAQRRMPVALWEYYSGAADEISLRWNREGYDRLRLRPRVLVDVSNVDTRIHLFGHDLPHPILLAPAADHRVAHPDGEIATARGAGDANAVMVLSSFTNTPVEAVGQSATAPFWFQVYIQRDREFTRDAVQRAVAAGAKALCVTVDTPVFGVRNRQARAKYELAPGLSRPHLPPPRKSSTSVPFEIFPDWNDPSLTWRDIAWLRSLVNVPVLIKGVLDPADGERAVQEGIAGIIVSNHGARNLDTVPATIDALPCVAEKVAGRIPVLVDGGIRRGTDVAKAIAMGANAVLIGRPYLYGLVVGGQHGVARILDILRREFEMAMALLGRPSIKDLDRSVIWS